MWKQSVQQVVDHPRLKWEDMDDFLQPVSLLRRASDDPCPTKHSEWFGSWEKRKCLVNWFSNVNFCCSFHLEEESSRKGEGQRALWYCPAGSWHRAEAPGWGGWTLFEGDENRWSVGPAHHGCWKSGEAITKGGRLIGKRLPQGQVWSRGNSSECCTSWWFFLVAVNLKLLICLFLAYTEHF